MNTEFERVLGLWFDFCYCGDKGAPKSKPEVDTYKLNEHDPGCQFRVRVSDEAERMK